MREFMEKCMFAFVYCPQRKDKRGRVFGCGRVHTANESLGDCQRSLVPNYLSDYEGMDFFKACQIIKKMTNRTPAFYNLLTRGWVVLDGNNIDHHDYHYLDLPDDGTYVFMFLIQVSKASTTKNVNIKVLWLNDRFDFFSNSKYHMCLFKQLPDSSTDFSELKNLDFKLAPFIVHSQCNPIDGPGNSLFNTCDVLNDYQTELPSINLVNELKPDLDYGVKKHWYTDWAYDIETTERAEKEDQFTYAVSYRPPF